MKIADKNFGINEQGLCVLQYLSNISPDFAERSNGLSLVEFYTYPWYNGRERGIVISMSSNFLSGKVLNIAIYEHRNSDELCCLKWETDTIYWNHPLEDVNIFDKAYKGKGKFDTDATFPYMSIKECGDWVYTTFKEFYLENHTYKNKDTK